MENGSGKRVRKSNYEDMVKPHLDKIREWAKETTDTEIARKLGIAQSTFATYKREHEELKDAVIAGRQELVNKLRDTIVKRATGYDYTEVKTITLYNKLPDEVKEMLRDAGITEDAIASITTIRKETFNRHMAPDVAALNLCLKNYDRENWANDPQMMAFREKELELRREKMEADNW